MSRDACWEQGVRAELSLLTEGSQPGTDVLTRVIAGSTGHVSSQSEETLEYTGYGGHQPHGE